MEAFINNLMLFRSCWFAGRYGGGKTSLAVEVALRLVLGGHVERIVSNVPLVFEPDAVIDVFDVVEIQDAAIIIDEAWHFLKSGSWKESDKFLAYPRHKNQVLLFPSVTPLTTYVRWVRVERVYNGLPVGLPLWLYRFDIDLGESSKRKGSGGRFIWWKPQSIFGWYQHKYDKKKHNPRMCYVYEVKQPDPA